MYNFEFDGEKYKKASSHQEEWGLKLIKELNLQGEENVLDLGCGDGRLTAKIAKLIPDGSVLGIDSSKGMIKSAKKLESDNLSFKLKNINEIKYQNELSVIFSNAALHWVKDHDRLIRNCYKALKNNGLIRFNFAGDCNCSNFYAVIKDVMYSSEYNEDFNDFIWPWYMPEVDVYKSFLGNMGFKHIKVWGENADRYFDDQEQMIRWIEQPAIVPFLSHLSENKHKEFKEIVIDNMIKRTKKKDGRCFETFRRINVLAKKD